MSNNKSIVLSKEQNRMIDVMKKRIDPGTTLQHNTIAMCISPTASGKTTMSFHKVIPMALEYKYDLVVFTTTSKDNIDNVVSRFEYDIDDISNTTLLSLQQQNKKKEAKNKLKKLFSSNRQVVLPCTHSLFNDIADTIDLLAKEYDLSVLIIKDEASKASITGDDASYAVNGSLIGTISINLAKTTMLLRNPKIRAIGLTGTATEEQSKYFTNVRSMKDKFDHHGIPYPLEWTNNLSKFIGEENSKIPLEEVSSKLGIGDYSSSDIYEIIYESVDSRRSKSFIKDKFFYKLQSIAGAAASKFAFRVQFEKMILKTFDMRSKQESCYNQFLKRNVSNISKTKPYKSMSLVFAGHEYDDDTKVGKSLLLWNDALDEIRGVCEKHSLDQDSIICYSSETLETLSGEDLSDQNFQDVLDTREVTCVVTKFKLTDGFDEPRFKYILSARQLDQPLRAKNGHAPAILRAGQMCGRVERINNGIDGVWDREQLKSFLKMMLIQDKELYKLYLEWVILNNATELYLPESPTMCYAALVDCERAGYLEDFLKEIEVSNDIFSGINNSNTPWSQEGTNEYKDHRECELCKKVTSGDYVDVPSCEVGYLMQGWSREKIWLTNDIDHIDGCHTNNHPDNIVSTCKPQHADKSRESGDYINKRYKSAA
jgi:hypothetical protein